MPLLFLICLILPTYAQADWDNYVREIEIQRSYYDRLAKLLFPASAAWDQIDKFPEPKNGWVKDHRDQLKGIFTVYPLQIPECFAEGLFNEADDNETDPNSHFYFLDFRNSGKTDLLYVGDEKCNEGHVGVLLENGLAATRIVNFDFYPLFIKRKDEPDLVSVGIGCCAEPDDKYILAEYSNAYFIDTDKLVDPDIKKSITVSKRLQLPDDLKTENKERVIFFPVAIRYEPKQDDTLDTTAEYGPMERDQYGNILQKYDAGSHALEIASYNDHSGTTWLLLEFTANSKVSYDYGDFGISVGWVKADCLKKACQIPDLK